MFKSQFYLYFSNSKRKRPENVHLYWLIYWEISANTLAHFTKQRKAEMWQIAIRSNKRVYLWSANFLQRFISFYCCWRILRLPDSRNWEHLPPSYQQYLQFLKAEMVVILLCSWSVPEANLVFDDHSNQKRQSYTQFITRREL